MNYIEKLKQLRQIEAETTFFKLRDDLRSLTGKIEGCNNLQALAVLKTTADSLIKKLEALKKDCTPFGVWSNDMEAELCFYIEFWAE